MGLFGKKKYVKNFTSDNNFLESYAVRIQGLLGYVEDNERIKKALEKLKNDFHYTIGTAAKNAKKNEARIDCLYDELKEAFQKPQLDEEAVLRIIRSIGIELNEINAK